MAENKPKKKRSVKKAKPLKEEPKEEKEEDSWEDFLSDENFDSETENKESKTIEESVIEESPKQEEEFEEEEELIEEDEIEKEEVRNNNMKKEEDIKSKVGDIRFPVLEKTSDGKKITQDMFGNIPIEVTVELGRTSVSLKDVYELNEGSIIELERLAGEPLDLVVNGQIVADGEVVAVDDNYGLRITKILSEQ